MSPAEWPPVPRLWPGETVAILAGGPSLTADQVDYVRGKARVIAINNAYRLAPWADALYACDGEWWDSYRPEFAGLKITQDAAAAQKHGLLHVPLSNQPATGISLDPQFIHSGRNGGYQALNLSVHLAGPGLRILLGYDMKRANGRRHWHADHGPGMKNPDEFLFQLWIDAYDTARLDLHRAQVNVVNASPDSALLCFPRKPLQDVL